MNFRSFLEGISYECKIYHLFASMPCLYSHHYQACSYKRLNLVLVPAVKLNCDEHNKARTVNEIVQSICCMLKDCELLNKQYKI